jgi:hypothetical protein
MRIFDPLTEFKLDDATALLRNTPGLLKSWLSGMPACWTECHTGPDTFSPFDVVGHLIHGEKTDWIPRLRIILEHGTGRPFEPFDRFAMHSASKDKSITMLLTEFAELRAESLEELRRLNLSESDLQKEGVHPEFGHVTASQLIATWATHDLNHIGQIARSMAFRYRDEVGPWRKYLSILPQG